jgi:hypothetical protein
MDWSGLFREHTCTMWQFVTLSPVFGVIKTRVSKAEVAAESNGRTLLVERNPLSEQLAQAYTGPGKYTFEVELSRPAFEVCAFARLLGEN